MMTLTNEVRRTIDHLKANPYAAPYQPRDLPQSLARHLQKHFMKLVRSRWDEMDERWTRHLAFFSPSQPALRDLYGALLDMGVDDDDVIRRLLLWTLESRIMGIPEQSIASDLGVLGQPDRAILDLASRMGDLSGDADYVLAYALGNHLCYYSESEWHLTGLGRTFLRLSALQATRFLLSLEVFLHASSHDWMHMSREFLMAFLQTDGQPFAAIVADPASQHDSHYDSWVDYHNRLREFGVAADFLERDVPQVTTVGRLIVESVLDRDSAFDALIPLYVREEILGVGSSDFSSDGDAARIRALLDRSPLVGELREPILDEIERLRQANAAYLSVFKALAPCIEGILRNLTATEQMKVSGSGLGAYVKAFEATNPPILKPGTVQMIDGVFRPYRNIVEHGHVIAPEPARMLCEISLSVIEQIHKDYVEFRDQ